MAEPLSRIEEPGHPGDGASPKDGGTGGERPGSVLADGGVWQGYERGGRGYRAVLLALFFAGIATFAQLYSFQGVLPILARDLGINAAQASLTVSAATMGLAVAVIPWSLVSDRFGRRRTIAAAVIAATVLGVAGALMPGFAAVVVFRFLEGAALGGVPAVAMTYLSEEVRKSHVAVAAGTFVSGTSLGGLSGRLVAAPVGDFLGWRAGVLAVALVAACSTVAFLMIAPRQRGFIRRTTRLRGADGLVARLLTNLRDPGLIALYLQSFLLMGSFVAMYNYLGFHLGGPPFNVPQGVVSLLFLSYLIGTWTSTVAGRLAERHGRRRVLISSALLMLAGAAGTLIAWLPAIVVSLLLFTGGFFAAHSVANGWVPIRARIGPAQASSLYTLFYYVGSSVFGYLIGMLLNAAGWSAAVGGIAALILVAVASAMLLLRPDPKGRPAR